MKTASMELESKTPSRLGPKFHRTGGHSLIKPCSRLDLWLEQLTIRSNLLGAIFFNSEKYGNKKGRRASHPGRNAQW